MISLLCHEMKNINRHLSMVKLVMLLTKCKKYNLCQVDWRVFEDFLTKYSSFFHNSFSDIKKWLPNRTYQIYMSKHKNVMEMKRSEAVV